MKKLLVLKKILKWVLIAIVLGGIGFSALIKVEKWYEEQVIIKILPNNKYCDDHKITKHFFFIENRSDKIVREIRVSADGYKKGYSNIIGEIYFSSYKILQPQETMSGCIALKKPSIGLLNRPYVTEKNLEIYITRKDIYFQK